MSPAEEIKSTICELENIVKTIDLAAGVHADLEEKLSQASIALKQILSLVRENKTLQHYGI